jgi:phosphotriesterase-related protein
MVWLSWVFATFAFEPQGVIMTVRGPIAPSEFGMVLVHEHVMCDFVGADKTGRHRYDPEEVIATMLPYLRSVKERGFSGFVDATPAYIGRDPLVLKRLSELTGLHILTNTGYYGAAGDKFLPPHAFSETADQLAERWVAEWRNGIEGTGIKPGFIKIGVDPGPLSEIDRKLVVAAARTHLQTGLTIACHTGEARAALEVLEVVKSEGVDPSALIIVHADSIPDQSVHEKLAKEGAWVEYDAIGAKPINEHVRLISEMVRKGFADKLLLSHDAGWYWVGEPNGGKEKIRPYTALSDELVPALKNAGLTEATLKRLLVENPKEAFTVRIRKR